MPASASPPPLPDATLDENELDEALEETFPASDPPAITPTRIGPPAKSETEDAEGANPPVDGDANPDANP